MLNNLAGMTQEELAEKMNVSRQSISKWESGVRKHEDYMGKYFISQYGAIKDIDFTPIFEQLLEDEREM